ncbi:MAG: c-type cytochrome [Acidobacteria bacterium]|nr:c-type cytochrome [Acidobacteriota bacterium]
MYSIAMMLVNVFWVMTLASHAQDIADPALGKRLFESQCVLCHGQNGTGGRGPSLNRPNLEKAPDDKRLDRVIGEGIGPEMPGAWQLSPREVASVRAYVRTLGAMPQEPLPGDATRGAAVYRDKGCGGCHIVMGEGGGFGPELSAIGTRRNAKHLREAIVEPAAFVPEDYMMVEATTAVGTVRGVRANEDAFTVQVKTADGKFASYRKADLKALRRPAGQSLMPSYKGKVTEAELDDVVSYLANLRGRQ